MVNKLFLVLATVIFLCSTINLFAQKQLTKAEYHKQMRVLLNKDPRVPSFKGKELEKLLKTMREKFVDFSFPADWKTLKGKEIPNPLLLQVTAKKYKKMLDNPELEEATGNQLKWYNAVGSAFVDLYASLTIIQKVYMHQNPEAYATAVAEFNKYAQILKKVLNTPVKVSPKELNSMKSKNTQKRRILLQKQIRELQKRGYKHE